MPLYPDIVRLYFAASESTLKVLDAEYTFNILYTGRKRNVKQLTEKLDFVEITAVKCKVT